MVGLLALCVLAGPPKLSVKEFNADLRHARRDHDFALQMAESLRNWFKKDLATGASTKTDQTAVVWCIEASGTPTMVADDGSFKLRLERIGDTNVYAGEADLPDGDGFKYHFEVNGQSTGGGFVEVYKAPPEAKLLPGVTPGKLTRMPDWHSTVFAGTTRDWYVYIPAGLAHDEAASVMVFQDGAGMKNAVVPVFDNLIAKGEMPKTVGIFISPGVFADKKSNRSFEYDTLSEAYSRFLLDEILPEVEKIVNLKHDPASRAIGGASSGGICAFTVAWQHPEAFGKVMSWVGSFTDIAHGPSLDAGGHNYPFLIRLSDPKPIRVFLQDGANDLDNLFGNWPLANQQMAHALEFKHYDYKFVFGKGHHSGQHGEAILPDTLRWLWRPTPQN